MVSLLRAALALVLSAGLAQADAQTDTIAPERQPTIGAPEAVFLVRSALLTLNDANKSGNYSVLRDLAAPGFQAQHTPADLALAFADLRQRKFDLFGVLLIMPRFHAPPEIDNGRLRLRGVFPTQPRQIAFDLEFERDGPSWRVAAIGVSTPDVAASRITDAHDTLNRTP